MSDDPNNSSRLLKNIYKLRIWMKSYFVQDPFVFTKSVVVNDFQLFDQSGFSGFGRSEEKNFNVEIPGLQIIQMIYLGFVFTVEAEKEFWITSVAHSQTELASSHKQLALHWSLFVYRDFDNLTLESFTVWHWNSWKRVGVQKTKIVTRHKSRQSDCRFLLRKLTSYFFHSVCVTI